MLERDGFPPGVPAWIDSHQPDPDAASAFYGGLFGWTFHDASPAGGAERYLVATLEGRNLAAISSRRRESPDSPTWNTYVGVDDADEAVARVREAGGRVVTEPHDVSDVARVAAVADPAGAQIGLWQPGSIKGAQRVNAPGTWNFSELNTHDVEEARRFYGAAFGWEAHAVTMGALAGTMVRLPGYADFLEQFDPGIRQRHADFGAPPGFSDCIAWFLPLPAGESPYWSVTFSVADTDATAARARELGGTVLVEPFDIAPVRSAVLLDPAGARFTVSAFSPG